MRIKKPLMPLSAAVFGWVFFFILASSALAAQPTIVALQGKLTNTTTGAIIYSSTLRVNISDVNGIEVWNQTYPNAVSAGFFDLLLGADATNPLNLTYNQDYNISVYAGSSPTQIGGSFRFRSSIGQISPSNLSAGDFSASGTFSFGTTLVVDKTNGKVGVGTNAPLSTLHVNGTGPQGGFRITNDSGYTAFFVNSTIGRVGIGNLQPSAKLDVNGSIASSGGTFDIDSDSIQMSYESSLTGGRVIAFGPNPTTSGKLHLYVGESDGGGQFGMTLDNTGYFGVGSTSPTKKLEVSDATWSVTVDPSAFMPTINTTSPGGISKNLTIASEDGSVIVQLG